MSSTHMSLGKRKGCTAYARYAMSMNRTKGRAAVAPAWTPWIVPWGIPKSCARVFDCQGPRGRAYEKPSVWVARWLASPGPHGLPQWGGHPGR